MHVRKRLLTYMLYIHIPTHICHIRIHTHDVYLRQNPRFLARSDLNLASFTIFHIEKEVACPCHGIWSWHVTQHV
jgi:hypothetical protein